MDRLHRHVFLAPWASADGIAGGHDLLCWLCGERRAMDPDGGFVAQVHAFTREHQHEQDAADAGGA